ncbi:MAG: glycosyltransferase [Oenococcus sp.]|uniref:glycosyltransferase n=1 Tax=Oenococcus sp. TaxID=1979414 RepID=UPI0039EB9489
MKILIINTIPFNLNGMSMTIMNYFNHFDHTKFHVDFVVNGLIEEVFSKNIQSHGGKIFLFKSRNRNPINYAFRLHRIIQENHYDLIYIHGNSATMSFELVACVGTGAKTVVHAHGQSTDHPILHKLLYPFFITHYDVAFAASTLSGKWLFGQKKYEVINNGIEPRKFRFDSAKRERLRWQQSLDTSTKVILQVGSFTEQKNHSFAITLFNELLHQNSNYRLWFLGEGPLKQSCIDRAKDLGISDKIKFFPPTVNTSDYYSAADLCIFPSKWEPFGIVALEAQAADLPVLLSDKFVKNVKLTENVHFLPLKVTKWVDKIQSLKTVVRGGHLTNFQEHGYDINQNALDLQVRFEEILNE